MENLLIALNAVIPFVFYLSIGYFSRISGITDQLTLDKINSLCFRVFFPFLTFVNIYSIDLKIFSDSKMMLAIALFLFAIIGICLLTVPRIIKDNPRRGVIIQALYRGNYVIYGIPLATSVFGGIGAAYASMVVAIVVPIYNVVSVMILEYFNGSGFRSAKKYIIELLKNPLLQGSILGFIFCIFHIKLPTFIALPCETLAAVATPIAVFVLGGSFYFGGAKKNIKYITAIILIRLIAIPAGITCVSILLGFRGIELFCIMTVFATPVAMSSYPMAVNMGGDGELAGQLVVISTVLSALTMFFWILIMKTIGLI